MNAEVKPKRKFSRTSTTWQLFNKFFFLDTPMYPYSTPPMPRGSAINLVQGLNCCNIQWAEEQGMPLSFLTLSAKAKSTDPLNPKNHNVPWVVEISENQRHGPEGRKRASSAAWMQALLAQPVEGELPANGPASSPVPGELANASVYVPSGTEALEPQGENIPPAPARSAPPSMEDMIGSWVAGGELGGGAKDSPAGAQGGEK